MNNEKDKYRRIVSCFTCCIALSLEPGADVEQICWDNTWDLNKADEEMDAFIHGKNNPMHIMLEGVDWEQRVNGIDP